MLGPASLCPEEYLFAVRRGVWECGGSTPPGNNATDEDQGGVAPPHSKVPLQKV
jgi:hypothetical protein